MNGALGMKTPITSPSSAWDEVYRRLGPAQFQEQLKSARPTVGDRWVHWDKLRHLDPPEDLDHESWWLLIGLARQQLHFSTPLVTTDGAHFDLAIPNVMLEMLQSIDARTAGRIGIGERIGEHQARRSWLISSLSEEAIRSSQLEGASTSRVVAKEMLLSGRPARTRSERMIANNYRAMNFVREHRNDQLTVELIRRLHVIVTEDTLEDPADAGRLQTSAETRVHVLDETGQTLHRPPPADELSGRIAALCQFANGDDTGDRFLHPVLRSVLVHFWLSHDHPFVDGNGRTARALFYWSMLHRGYWLAEYLTISAILRAAPSRYARSFLYSELEDDLTYFVLHQLEVVQRAIDGLEAYLERKIMEMGQARELLRTGDYNHRQAALLEHALRNPNAEYTYSGHANAHGVVVPTARTDLLALVDRELLEQQRIGRKLHFFPVDDLRARLG